MTRYLNYDNIGVVRNNYNVFVRKFFERGYSENCEHYIGLHFKMILAM